MSSERVTESASDVSSSSASEKVVATGAPSKEAVASDGKTTGVTVTSVGWADVVSADATTPIPMPACQLHPTRWTTSWPVCSRVQPPWGRRGDMDLMMR